MQYSAGLQPATVDRQRYSFSSGWNLSIRMAAQAQRGFSSEGMQQSGRQDDLPWGSELLASPLRSELNHEYDSILLKGSAGI